LFFNLFMCSCANILFLPHFPSFCINLAIFINSVSCFGLSFLNLFLYPYFSLFSFFSHPFICFCLSSILSTFLSCFLFTYFLSLFLSTLFSFCLTFFLLVILCMTYLWI
jgi:hypothetical protein